MKYAGKTYSIQALAMLAFFAFWHVLSGVPLLLYLGIASFFLLLLPQTGLPLLRAWSQFGRYLGLLVNTLLLTLVFFLFLTPLALLRRTLGKDRLRLNRDDSYFSEGQKTYDLEDVREMW
jgi:hypothetical protein